MFDSIAFGDRRRIATCASVRRSVEWTKTRWYACSSSLRGLYASLFSSARRMRRIIAARPRSSAAVDRLADSRSSFERSLCQSSRATFSGFSRRGSLRSTCRATEGQSSKASSISGTMIRSGGKSGRADRAEPRKPASSPWVRKMACSPAAASHPGHQLGGVGMARIEIEQADRALTSTSSPWMRTR